MFVIILMQTDPKQILLLVRNQLPSGSYMQLQNVTHKSIEKLFLAICAKTDYNTVLRCCHLLNHHQGFMQSPAGAQIYKIHLAVSLTEYSSEKTIQKLIYWINQVRTLNLPLLLEDVKDLLQQVLMNQSPERKDQVAKSIRSSQDWIIHMRNQLKSQPVFSQSPDIPAQELPIEIKQDPQLVRLIGCGREALKNIPKSLPQWHIQSLLLMHRMQKASQTNKYNLQPQEKSSIEKLKEVVFRRLKGTVTLAQKFEQYKRVFETNQDIDKLLTLCTAIKKQLSPIDVYELQDLIRKNEFSKNLILNKNVVLFFGMTGVGKTTTILRLLGYRMMEARQLRMTTFIPVDNIQEEHKALKTSPTSQSVTRYIFAAQIPPNLLKGINKNLWITDSPGFGDTGGPEIDIGNCIGTIEALKGCKSVRFAAVLSGKSWGDRGQGVKDVLRIMSSLFIDLQEARESIIFVLNKFSPIEIQELSPKIDDLIRKMSPAEKNNDRLEQFLQYLKYCIEERKYLVFHPMITDEKVIETLSSIGNHKSFTSLSNGLQSNFTESTRASIKEYCLKIYQLVQYSLSHDEIDEAAFYLGNLKAFNQILPHQPAQPTETTNKVKKLLTQYSQSKRDELEMLYRRLFEMGASENSAEKFTYYKDRLKAMSKLRQFCEDSTLLPTETDFIQIGNSAKDRRYNEIFSQSNGRFNLTKKAVIQCLNYLSVIQDEPFRLKLEAKVEGFNLKCQRTLEEILKTPEWMNSVHPIIKQSDIAFQVYQSLIGDRDQKKNQARLKVTAFLKDKKSLIFKLLQVKQSNNFSATLKSYVEIKEGQKKDAMRASQIYQQIETLAEIPDEAQSPSQSLSRIATNICLEIRTNCKDYIKNQISRIIILLQSKDPLTKQGSINLAEKLEEVRSIAEASFLLEVKNQDVKNIQSKLKQKIDRSKESFIKMIAEMTQETPIKIDQATTNLKKSISILKFLTPKKLLFHNESISFNDSEMHGQFQRMLSINEEIIRRSPILIRQKINEKNVKNLVIVHENMHIITKCLAQYLHKDHQGHIEKLIQTIKQNVYHNFNQEKKILQKLVQPFKEPNLKAKQLDNLIISQNRIPKLENLEKIFELVRSQIESVQDSLEKGIQTIWQTIVKILNQFISKMGNLLLRKFKITDALHKLPFYTENTENNSPNLINSFTFYQKCYHMVAGFAKNSSICQSMGQNLDRSREGTENNILEAHEDIMDSVHVMSELTKQLKNIFLSIKQDSQNLSQIKDNTDRAEKIRQLLDLCPRIQTLSRIYQNENKISEQELQSIKLNLELRRKECSNSIGQYIKDMFSESQSLVFQSFIEIYSSLKNRANSVNQFSELKKQLSLYIRKKCLILQSNQNIFTVEDFNSKEFQDSFLEFINLYSLKAQFLNSEMKDDPQIVQIFKQFKESQQIKHIVSYFEKEFERILNNILSFKIKDAQQQASIMMNAENKLGSLRGQENSSNAISLYPGQEVIKNILSQRFSGHLEQFNKKTRGQIVVFLLNRAKAKVNNLKEDPLTVEMIQDPFMPTLYRNLMDEDRINFNTNLYEFIERQKITIRQLYEKNAPQADLRIQRIVKSIRKLHHAPIQLLGHLAIIKSDIFREDTQQITQLNKEFSDQKFQISNAINIFKKFKNCLKQKHCQDIISIIQKFWKQETIRVKDETDCKKIVQIMQKTIWSHRSIMFKENVFELVSTNSKQEKEEPFIEKFKNVLKDLESQCDNNLNEVQQNCFQQLTKQTQKLIYKLNYNSQQVLNPQIANLLFAFQILQKNQTLLVKPKRYQQLVAIVQGFLQKSITQMETSKNTTDFSNNSVTQYELNQKLLVSYQKEAQLATRFFECQDIQIYASLKARFMTNSTEMHQKISNYAQQLNKLAMQLKKEQFYKTQTRIFTKKQIKPYLQRLQENLIKIAKGKVYCQIVTKCRPKLTYEDKQILSAMDKTFNDGCNRAVQQLYAAYAKIENSYPKHFDFYQRMMETSYEIQRQNVANQHVFGVKDYLNQKFENKFQAFCVELIKAIHDYQKNRNERMNNQRKQINQFDTKITTLIAQRDKKSYQIWQEYETKCLQIQKGHQSFVEKKNLINKLGAVKQNLQNDNTNFTQDQLNLIRNLRLGVCQKVADQDKIQLNIIVYKLQIFKKIEVESQLYSELAKKQTAVACKSIASYGKKLCKEIEEMLCKLEQSQYAQMLLKDQEIFKASATIGFRTYSKAQDLDYVLNHLNVSPQIKKRLHDDYKLYERTKEPDLIAFKDDCANYSFSSLIAHIKSLGCNDPSQASKVRYVELLAKILTLWTLRKAEISEGNSVEFLMEPHPAQVIAILLMIRLEKIHNQRFLLNKLVQIGTGQGKSVVLAALSCYLALIGFEVYCACYSSYLSQRDMEAFQDLFNELGVTSKIHYGTFSDHCEKMLNEMPSRSFKDFMREIITNNKHDTNLTEKISRWFKQIFESNKYQQNQSNKVLLIDQFDVFFDQRFFGQLYLPAVSLRSESISKLIEFAWSQRSINNGVALRKEIINSSQWTQVKAQFHRISDILDSKVNEMVESLITVNNQGHKYWVSDGKIKYKDGDTLTDKFSYDFLTTFAHCLEYDNKKITESQKDSAMHIKIKVAALSYSELPRQFGLILGVSGTIETMTVSHKYILKDHYGFHSFLIMPSIYGQQSDRRTLTAKVCKQEDKQQLVIAEIEKSINEKRPALVFFKSANELVQFYLKPEYSHLTSATMTITEEDDPQARDSRIKTSTNPKRVTFLTESFSRGTDFVVFDKAINERGGVHVIQTYLSQSESDQIQIQGRTARQGRKGTFALIVSNHELPQIGLPQQIIEQKIFESLTTVRSMNENIQAEKTFKNANQCFIVHKKTIEALCKQEVEKLMSLAVQLNAFPEPKEKVLNIVLAIDGTGSMGGAIRKVTEVLSTTFERSIKVLEAKKIQTEIKCQVAVYRNYNVEANLALQKSDSTSNVATVTQFLKNIQVAGGMGNQAIELVLNHVVSLPPQMEPKLVFLIGDMGCHSETQQKARRASNRGENYWVNNSLPYVRLDEVRAKIIDKNIIFHSMFVPSYPAQGQYFKKVSQDTKGQFFQIDFRLPNLANLMTDFFAQRLVYAIGGQDLVQVYKNLFIKATY